MHRLPVQNAPKKSSRKAHSIDASGRRNGVTKAGALLKGRQGTAAAPSPNAEVNDALKKAESAQNKADSNTKAEVAEKAAAADTDGLNKKGKEKTPDEERLAYEKKVAANPWFYAIPEWARIIIAFIIVTLMVGFVLQLVKSQPGLAFQAIMADPEVKEIEAERAKLLAKVAELDANVAKHTQEIEARQARESGQSEEEIFLEKKKKAEEKAMKGEEMLKDYVFDVYNQFAPLLAKKDKLEKVMKGGLFDAKEKAQKLAFQKIADVGTEVISTLECEDMMAEIKALAQAQNAAEEVTSDTPLALLLAGLVAPMMLSGMAATNKIQALMYFPLLLLFTATFAIDFGAVCDEKVWFWFFGMWALLLSSVSVRLWVAALAQKTTDQMKASNANLKADVNVGNSSSDAPNPIFVLREKLVTGSRDYFRALFGYDTIVHTKAFQSLNQVTLLIFLWGALGVWISIHDVVDDELSCKAEIVVSILHIYSFFWLMFASLTVVTLVIWLVTVIATNEDFALGMLHKAENFDNSYMPGGFPFVALLIRAFILRDSSDMTRLEVRTLEKEIKELSEKKEKLEKKKAGVDDLLTTKKEKQNIRTAARMTQMQGMMAERAGSMRDGLSSAVSSMGVSSMGANLRDLSSAGGAQLGGLQDAMAGASQGVSGGFGSLNLAGLQEAASEAASGVAQAAQEAGAEFAGEEADAVGELPRRPGAATFRAYDSEVPPPEQRPRRGGGGDSSGEGTPGSSGS